MPLAGHRGSGERADALQEGAEVLDDDLFLAQELVHHRGQGLPSGAERDDRQGSVGAAARDPEQAIETHEIH